MDEDGLWRTSVQDDLIKNRMLTEVCGLGWKIIIRTHCPPKIIEIIEKFTATLRGYSMGTKSGCPNMMSILLRCLLLWVHLTNARH